MKRARVGKVEVIALVDAIESYDANAVYIDAAGATAPFSGYLDNEGRVALNFGCFLLRDGGRTILVDTGWGPEHHGPLPDELCADAAVLRCALRGGGRRRGVRRGGRCGDEAWDGST